MNRLIMYWIGILAGAVSLAVFLIWLESDAGPLGSQIHYWLVSGYYFIAYFLLSWTCLKKRMK